MTHTANDLARAMSRAEEWAASDPDPQTKGEALGIINLVTLGDESGEKAIISQFSGKLSFGTAGLRGELGAGPNRMNRVVVMHASAAFARWLNEHAAAGETQNPPHIVVGFDARTNSNYFARTAAEVFAGAGLKVTLLPGPLPTPVTAFTVRNMNASAGVMITASHNPPKDNGYKVFLGDKDSGSQIVSPVDTEIAAYIDEFAAAPLSSITLSPDYTLAGDEIIEAYVEAMAAGIVSAESDTDLKIVYTAMHGVGSQTTSRLFERASLPTLHHVHEQDTPDAAFPTVAFPNPEEPGALDLALKTAAEVSADLIIAQDPDADRLAVAIADKNNETGYRVLTGNELGLLLGWQAAEEFRAQNSSAPGALSCTIVSSPALAPVAKKFDLEYAETLSGFKWVSRVPNLVFGFEEALGYLTQPSLVRDKDGISASVDITRLAIHLRKEGKTLIDRLEQAATEFGAFASGQITFRFASRAEAELVAGRIRQDPPKSFGTHEIVKVTDLLQPGNSEIPADVMRFDLSDGSRVMVRPSGTEPKLKIYLDVSSTAGTAVERQADAQNKLKDLEAGVREALQ